MRSSQLRSWRFTQSTQGRGRLRGVIRSTVFCAFLLSTAELVRAAAGELDPSFGGVGYTRVGLGFSPDYANAVAVQSNGKIVVAGIAKEDSFGVIRYNPDGSLDSSFGRGGKVVTDFPASLGNDARAVRIQSDGKIVVAGITGVSGGTHAIAVVRYNPDGSLDTSFDGDGRVTTRFVNDDVDVAAMVIQPDGKIVVGGEIAVDNSPSGRDFLLVRYLSTGSLDPSFDGDGQLVTPMRSPANDGIRALTLNGTDIFAAGYAGDEFAIARYNSDGSLDGSFAVGGKKFYAFSGKAEAMGVAVQVGTTALQSDKLVVAGYAPFGTGRAFAVLRLDMSGQPDPSFSGDGDVLTPILGNDTATGLLVHETRDTPLKIVVSGYCASSPSAQRFCAVRYNADGSRDSSFDGDGIVTTGLRDSDRARAIVRQSLDGKYVLVGDSFDDNDLPSGVGREGGFEFAVVRYNVDGSLDTSFDTDGKRTDKVSDGPGTAYAVALQADGKIVTAGERDVPALARQNADGSLDNSFAGDGTLLIPVAQGDGRFQAVALQGDGKIVAAGSAEAKVLLVRCLPNGSLDPTFDGDGKVTLAVRQAAVATSLAIQPDGKIVIAGSARDLARRDMLVARFNPDGSPDTSFAGSGSFLTVTGVASQARSVALQADGKIVVAGNSGNDLVVVRYNANGSPDVFFSQDGIASATIGSYAEAEAVAIQPDGKILAAGTTSSSSSSDAFAVVRYNADGSLDSSFTGSGQVITRIGSEQDLAYALVLQPDGKFIVAGSSYTDAVRVRDFAAVRYNSDGSVDTSFGSGGKFLLDVGADTARAAALDSRGRLILAGDFTNTFGVARLTTDLVPLRLANISTRMRVETGDNVLIAGFIVTGTEQKRIIVRALGPSLPVGDRLANPLLDLYDRDGNPIGSNDNWQDAPNRQEIIDTGIAPPNELESAILRNVSPGPSTAIVRGAGDRQGVGLVEVYDLGGAQDAKLANISTRGRVLTGDDVMIAGVIITGSGAQKVLLRASGPSLGIPGSLEDPLVELFDGNGNPMASNNNWKDTQRAEIEATGIPPSNDLDAAIVATLPAAGHTTVVRGVNDGTGVALVEVYALD